MPRTTTATPNLDALARRAPVTPACAGDDLLALVEASEGNGFIGEISLEEIDQFAADLTLVDVFDMPEILDTPLIQQLPAVVAGQAILLDEPTSGTHYPNYIAVAESILEGLQAIENLDPDLVYTDEATEESSD